MRQGIKGVSFYYYLKTSTRIVLLPLIFPPSSSPLPHFPSTLPSILSLLFLVHLWPRRPPQETHQLCLGLQPSQFTSVYSTAVHVRVWEHYGLYISTQSRATCTPVIMCISLSFAETGHPRGNSSISWPDSGNRAKQDKPVFNQDQTLERQILQRSAEETSDLE